MTNNKNPLDLCKAIQEKLKSEVVIECPPENASSILKEIEVLNTIDELGGFIEKHGFAVPNTKSYINMIRDLEVVHSQKYYDSYFDVRGEEVNAIVDMIQDDIAMIKINKNLDWYQTKNLINILHDKRDKLIFPVTSSTKVEGKIINTEWDTKREIALLTLCEEKSSREDVEPKLNIFTFIDYIDRRKYRVLDKLTVGFYSYRFYDTFNKRYVLLLSDVELYTDIDIVYGLLVEYVDYVVIGNYSKLRINYPILIVNSKVKSGVKSPCIELVFNRLGVTPRKFFDEDIRKSVFWIYRHPPWYERYKISQHLSGNGLGYPLHSIEIGSGSNGKTTELERYASIYGLSPEDIWDGEQSTLKSLIPNYHAQPPDAGYLTDCKYVVLLDEFFGRAFSIKKEERMEEYGTLKTLFEHKHRKGRSGKGDVNTNPTFKAFLKSNPKMAMDNLKDLVDKTDAAFIYRLLPYFITDAHQDFINGRKEDVQSLLNSGWKPDSSYIPDDVLCRVFLFYQQFFIKEFDVKRIRDIARHIEEDFKWESGVDVVVKGYLRARFSHHLICLLDGIVKYRLLCVGDFNCDNLTPTNEDYTMLREFAEVIASSWAKGFDVFKFSKNARENMLSSPALEVYGFIRQQKGHTTLEDIKAFCGEHKLDYRPAMQVLEHWELVVKFDEEVRSWWYQEWLEKKAFDGGNG